VAVPALEQVQDNPHNKVLLEAYRDNVLVASGVPAVARQVKHSCSSSRALPLVAVAREEVLDSSHNKVLLEAYLDCCHNRDLVDCSKHLVSQPNLRTQLEEELLAQKDQEDQKDQEKGRKKNLLQKVQKNLLQKVQKNLLQKVQKVQSLKEAGEQQEEED